MKAIILAGGFGKRLQSLVNNVPKPLAPVGDRPFLAHLLDYLHAQGFTEVILSLHYLADKIQAYFGSSYQALPIKHVVEPLPLGTGGAIAYALKTLTDNEPIFVLNGDTFVALDYQGMERHHRIKGSFLTMALTHAADCSRYGEVKFNEENLIEFSARGIKRAGFINAGVYLLSRHSLDAFALPEQFSFEQDFLYQSQVLSKIHYFMADKFFIDIGIPEDYQHFCRQMCPTYA